MIEAQAVTVTAAPQMITAFAANPTAPQYTPNGTFTVSATGGASANSVTFSIAAGSSAVCSISAATVTMLGAGSCTVLANQAGNGNYSSAAQATLVVPIGV